MSEGQLGFLALAAFLALVGERGLAATVCLIVGVWALL